MAGSRRIQLFSFGCAILTLFLACGTARSQEIRRVAEPFQQVRMARGGYVCEGKLTVSPIDNTYDTVSCTGPIYNAADYGALYAKLNRDELVRFNANTQEAISRDLKAAVHRQILMLPANLRQMAAIQSFERGLVDAIDERLPEGRGSNRAPRTGASPANPPAGPPPAP